LLARLYWNELGCEDPEVFVEGAREVISISLLELLFELSHLTVFFLFMPLEIIGARLCSKDSSSLSPPENCIDSEYSEGLLGSMYSGAILVTKSAGKFIISRFLYSRADIEGIRLEGFTGASSFTGDLAFFGGFPYSS